MGKESKQPAQLSESLLTASGHELKLVVTDESSDFSESKQPSDCKIYLKIAVDHLEVALEAAFWQMVADWVDDYYDIHPTGSYYNDYSPSAYLLRATFVGVIQGLTAAAYTFVQDRDLKKSCKFGLCSFAVGFVWQPLADVIPLNTTDSGAKDIITNNVIVGVGTAATLLVAKKALSMKSEEMPVLTATMGAIGFSDAYPVPVPEPKGIRGALGALICTAVGAGVGNILSVLGLFCSQKMKVSKPIVENEVKRVAPLTFP